MRVAGSYLSKTAALVARPSPIKNLPFRTRNHLAASVRRDKFRGVQPHPLQGPTAVLCSRRQVCRSLSPPGGAGRGVAAGLPPGCRQESTRPRVAARPASPRPHPGPSGPPELGPSLGEPHHCSCEEVPFIVIMLSPASREKEETQCPGPLHKAGMCQRRHVGSQQGAGEW